MIPTCPHAECPACAYVGREGAVPLEYDAILTAKEGRLRAALHAYEHARGASIDPALGAAPVSGYRTRAKWVIDAAEGPPRVGLYDGAHRVLDLPGCRVVPSAFLALADLLRIELAGRGRLAAIAADALAVDVRAIAGTYREGLLVTLVVDERSSHGIGRIERDCAEFFEHAGVLSGWVNRRARGSPQLLGPTTSHVFGERELFDTPGTARVVAAPGGFVQAHRGQAAALERALAMWTEALARELGRRPRVLELFAGAGALGLAMARSAEVTSVESHGPSAAGIDAIARAEGLAVHAVHADAATALARGAAGRGPFDLVVVDPPRRGLEPQLRAAIAALAPRAIAYVSCEPETLSRDAADLACRGYRLRSALPIDMIPLTEHVEALAILERGEAPPPTLLMERGALVAFDRPPHADTRALARGLRAARSGERPIGLEPLPGWSGVAIAGDATRARLEVELVALLHGVTRKRSQLAGRHHDATLKRLEVVAGHSVVRIRARLRGPRRAPPRGVFAALMARLAAFGHPPLGDPERCTEASRHHAFAAHGIDRPMVHLARAVLWPASDGAASAEAAPLEASSPLAPDWLAALESLRRSGAGAARRGAASG